MKNNARGGPRSLNAWIAKLPFLGVRQFWNWKCYKLKQRVVVLYTYTSDCFIWKWRVVHFDFWSKRSELLTLSVVFLMSGRCLEKYKYSGNNTRIRLATVQISRKYWIWVVFPPQIHKVGAFSCYHSVHMFFYVMVVSHFWALVKSRASHCRANLVPIQRQMTQKTQKMVYMMMMDRWVVMVVGKWMHAFRETPPLAHTSPTNGGPP